MTFCTSIHCMDGRIQEPTIRYIKDNYSIDYVDAITEPGPCKILAENKKNSLIQSIFSRTHISVHQHKSKMIFISGHYDCAGNPVNETIQREQIKKSISFINEEFPNLKIIGLWIDPAWKVNPL